MPRAQEANPVKLSCPKCGKAVQKGGQHRGKQLYHCSDRKGCNFHGIEPIGIEAAMSVGIDRTAADALHARVDAMDGKRRLVITAAQNATPVNKRFLASLLGYCRARGAQLVVIPYRYRNPTSIWSENAEHDDWWAKELTPYLLDQRVNLTPKLVLLADIKTQPTGVTPTQGFETISGAASAIIGHPRIELVTVPTPQKRMAKILTTTGAITERNYISSKAGKKAEFHHTFGACVVEIDGKHFHLRQINAVDDGSFIDLDTEYRGSVTRPVQLEALVMGDTHVEFVDPNVVVATFKGQGSIVGSLRPKTLVWHDVHDFYSRNHHHRGEIFINFVKHQTGRDNVKTWLDHTFDFIDDHTPAGVKNIFVPSNHPDALARWIKETDPRSDPENAIFWAETFVAMCKGATWTETGAHSIDPFAFWGRRSLKTAKQAVFLARDESHQIKGIEVNYHGDVGPNGARGSRLGFSRIGTKTVIGHSHSPGIRDGVYQTGTSSRLKLGYNVGPSSWMHTHCAIYANGKRSLIHIVDGTWRA